MAFEKATEIIKDSPEWAQLTDLAAERLGGKVLFATDDFFAEKENLIKPGRGIFIADKYTDRGKWMDGWESRRKRVEGHDWAVIQLATAGRIKGVDIDTHFFLGNHPPHASLEAIYLEAGETITNWDAQSLNWKEVLPRSPLDAGSQNFYAIDEDEVFTHVRLHIYPDGGVARLKVYGEVAMKWEKISPTQEIDLVAAIHGGKALACNDMFFSAMGNLLMPNRGINMGDGWETKRNRTPGNCDWVILKLAVPGTIHRVLIDTCHFKGNYPDSCSIDACLCDDDARVLNNSYAEWEVLLPSQKLRADAEHEFAIDPSARKVYSHVRLKIFPDGGVSRLRLFGKKMQ